MHIGFKAFDFQELPIVLKAIYRIYFFSLCEHDLLQLFVKKRFTLQLLYGFVLMHTVHPPVITERNLPPWSLREVFRPKCGVQEKKNTPMDFGFNRRLLELSRVSSPFKFLGLTI